MLPLVRLTKYVNDRPDGARVSDAKRITKHARA